MTSSQVRFRGKVVSLRDMGYDTTALNGSKSGKDARASDGRGGDDDDDDGHREGEVLHDSHDDGEEEEEDEGALSRDSSYSDSEMYSDDEGLTLVSFSSASAQSCPSLHSHSPSPSQARLAKSASTTRRPASPVVNTTPQASSSAATPSGRSQGKLQKHGSSNNVSMSSGGGSGSGTRSTGSGVYKSSTSGSGRTPAGMGQRPSFRHRFTRVAILDPEYEGPRSSIQGFLNLSLLVLIVLNFRLVLENILKYGLLVTWPGALIVFSNKITDWPLLVASCGLPLHVLIALAVERMAVPRRGSIPGFERTRLVPLVHILNIFALLAIPMVVITMYHTSVVPSLILLVTATVLFLKLISYCVECGALRSSYFENEKKHEKERKAGQPQATMPGVATMVRYPANLTLGSLLYFLSAPTLIYQANYPRTPRVRKRVLMRYIIEWIVCMMLLSFVFEQYVLPTVANSVQPLSEMRYVAIAERVLKLSIPNLYVWLLMFYSTFHLQMNIFAELLRFGDRQFYLDWWNATTLDYYWRCWNLPVHRWLSNYVYNPCLRIGLNKYTSGLIVFFVSAVFHELLVSVPCHTFRLWSFFAMMGQIPLISLTKWFPRDSSAGNFVFWLSFSIFGHPLLIILYYYEYYSMEMVGVGSV